jgi:hypothetical protein
MGLPKGSGVGNCRARLGRKERKSGKLAATQEALKRDATAPTATGVAEAEEEEQV